MARGVFSSVLVLLLAMAPQLGAGAEAVGSAVGGAGAGVPASRPAGRLVKVLIIHDPVPQVSPGLQSAVPALVNLLGHFACEVEALETETYQPGDLDPHDVVIYVGLQAGMKLPEVLLEDIQETAKPVCWLGENLDQLVERRPLERYGFQIASAQSEEGYGRVMYRGQSLSRPPKPLRALKVTRPADCHVLAEAEGDGGTLPYAVRSGHFWYFADPPIQTGSADGCYLVVCDQLHAFLGISHPPVRSALLCITGVHARTKADALRALTNLLRVEKTPFAVSVTPVYRDPGRDLEIPLSRERRLVGILREAQSAGATVIAHGLTHQAFGRTGEDAEFWDVHRDLPLAGQSEVGTERRIERSVGELVRCGLFPLLWATPQGRASPADYVKIAEHFSVAWERRMPSQDAREPQVFPFLILKDSYGQRLLPDNLPPLGKDGRVEPLLEQVHPQSLVPDPWVTVSMSPEAPLEAVRMLITELRGMEYRFVDLRRTTNWVRVQNLGIYSEETPRRLTELLPAGWDAFVVGPAQGHLTRYERAGRDGRQTAVLPPRAILVTHPAGTRLRAVFAFEGGPEAASHRLVSAIAAAAMVIGILLAGMFALVYVLQFFLRRA